jgi:hypothetical protein
MMLAYQRFTAELLLIYGSLFLSGVYYYLSVLVCRHENAQVLVKLGKSGSEIREMLVQVYGDSAMKKTAIYKCVTLFSEERERVTDRAMSRTEGNTAKVRQIVRENCRRMSEA